MNEKILNSKVVSFRHVLGRIAKVKEPNAIQQNLQSIEPVLGTLTEEETEAFTKELSELKIIMLSDMHIMQIVDLCPQNAIELRAILSSTRTTLTEEDINRILAVTKKYQPKKKA